MATFSHTGAGIGYHAGTEDGFVVQMQGRREWNVWEQSVLTEDYRHALCGSMRDVAADARPTAEPLLRCTLTPGDALYIPALFPHEGVTLETSLSLSLAWRGLSAADIWCVLSARRSNKPPDPALCCLLPDPAPGQFPALFLRNAIEQVFESLPQRERPSSEVVAAFIESLVDRSQSRI